MESIVRENHRKGSSFPDTVPECGQLCPRVAITSFSVHVFTSLLDKKSCCAPLFLAENPGIQAATPCRTPFRMNRTDFVNKTRATADQLLREKGYISPVDVLLAMGRLSKENYENWRFRRVPHLEKVLPGSLNKHALFCRELRIYARDHLKLKPSWTAYMSWGKGQKQRLRFTKYGQPHLEELYATHYVGARLAAPVSPQHSQ
jgi:hypothetical protein